MIYADVIVDISHEKLDRSFHENRGSLRMNRRSLLGAAAFGTAGLALPTLLPAPALAHAIYRATGVWHRSLPITPEQIAMGEE